MGKKKNIINRFMSGSFPDEVKLAFGSWLTDPEDQQEKEDALYSEWEALSARDISDSTLERRRKLNLIHRHMEGEKQKTLRSRFMYFVAVAAAAALIAGFFGLGRGIRSHSNTPSATSEVCMVTSSNSKGEFKLPDGTSVWLNIGSSLSYNSNFEKASVREVKLDGEAYFDVAKDGRSFVVNAGDLQVSVLGTRFAVRHTPLYERDQVTLVSGSVRVKGVGIQAVTLSPGEQLSYDRLLGDSTVRTVDTGDYVSWIRSQISLEDCTLGKVIENLEHRYRVKVSTLGDIDLDQHITLKINDESKEKIFTVLSFLADCELRIIDEGNIVLIR